MTQTNSNINTNAVEAQSEESEESYQPSLFVSSPAESVDDEDEEVDIEQPKRSWRNCWIL